MLKRPNTREIQRGIFKCDWPGICAVSLIEALPKNLSPKDREAKVREIRGRPICGTHIVQAGERGSNPRNILHIDANLAVGGLMPRNPPWAKEAEAKLRDDANRRRKAHGLPPLR